MKEGAFDNVKTVFVDLDDTIWWFTENSKVSLRHVFDSFGIGDYCDYESFNNRYHEKNAELWELYHHGKIEKEYLVSERFRYALTMAGYPCVDGGIGAKMNEEYLDFLSRLPKAVPGAAEMLAYLVERYDVNVLSNGFKGIQQRKLESAGLDKYVRKLVLSDDCGVTKPLPGIFAYALEVCGADAATTVMIGDNYDADIGGARDAGWRTIYFNNTGAEGTFDAADAVVTRLEEVRGLL